MNTQSELKHQERLKLAAQQRDEASLKEKEVVWDSDGVASKKPPKRRGSRAIVIAVVGFICALCLVWGIILFWATPLITQPTTKRPLESTQPTSASGAGNRAPQMGAREICFYNGQLSNDYVLYRVTLDTQFVAPQMDSYGCSPVPSSPFYWLPSRNLYAETTQDLLELREQDYVHFPAGTATICVDTISYVATFGDGYECAKSEQFATPQSTAPAATYVAGETAVINGIVGAYRNGSEFGLRDWYVIMDGPSNPEGRDISDYTYQSNGVAHTGNTRNYLFDLDGHTPPTASDIGEAFFDANGKWYSFFECFTFFMDASIAGEDVSLLEANGEVLWQTRCTTHYAAIDAGMELPDMRYTHTGDPVLPANWRYDD